MAPRAMDLGISAADNVPTLFRLWFTGSYSAPIAGFRTGSGCRPTFRDELPEQTIQLSVQFCSPDGSHHPDHEVCGGQIASSRSETFSDDALDPVTRGCTGNRLLTNHQAQAGTVHSIENRVQA